MASIQTATLIGFFLFLMLYLVVALGLAAYVPELIPTAVVSGIPARRDRADPQMLLRLLVLQAVAVLAFGIDTENRTLEELASNVPVRLAETTLEV
jgi:putative MFS transporter